MRSAIKKPLENFAQLLQTGEYILLN